MKRTCRIMILIFLLSLLLPSLPAAAEDGTATDLTRYLKVEQSGGHPNAKELLDAKLDDTIPYVQFEVVRLSWANAEQQPATLCIQWGKLPERVQLRQTDASGTVLSDEYAEEKASLEARLPELEKEITALKESVSGVHRFTELARKYTCVTELTPEVLRTFISKIVIHERERWHGKKSPQQIDIYFRFIGNAFADENKEAGKPEEKAG